MTQIVEALLFASDAPLSAGDIARVQRQTIEEGIASILSTPLLTEAGSIGALNIYSSTAAAFGQVMTEAVNATLRRAPERIRAPVGRRGRPAGNASSTASPSPPARCGPTGTAGW